jgi:hypothetical protein
LPQIVHPFPFDDVGQHQLAAFRGTPFARDPDKIADA